MAPKKKKETSPPSSSDGMFSGMFVFLLDTSVQPRRLQIWKQRLEQMGAKIEGYLSKRVTHIFAMNWNALKQKIDSKRLSTFKGSILAYQWLEDSLKLGEKVSEDFYLLKEEPGANVSCQPSGEEPSGEVSGNTNGNALGSVEPPHHKKLRSSSPQYSNNSTRSLPKDSRDLSAESRGTGTSDELHEESYTSKSYLDSQTVNSNVAGFPDTKANTYNPPDLNKNITDIFKKLIDKYRALGEDRRSFSYYKAIPVIEKLPFKIESADQVKGLPNIGKSLRDHIQEIVSTGKMSKLEHFEKDDKHTIVVCSSHLLPFLHTLHKRGCSHNNLVALPYHLISTVLQLVKTISLFGEVWGVGPTTAQKLYDKGYRTLEDLKNEPSLTKAQKLGLQYFDDIKIRIPRHEVSEMEKMLQKIGEEVMPGVVIVCGGSYRRGKSSCGDMDIIITHPDGQSHKGFLAKFVKRLKDMNFLREDLAVSYHSEEGKDSAVDTYFGLCTYPGRELRHRIDLKVFPKSIYVFGLIHWTGNDTLNRRLRIVASSKGYRLDDTGLFFASSSGGERGSRGPTSLHFDTEKEVFDFLEYPWLEPHERNL